MYTISEVNFYCNYDIQQQIVLTDLSTLYARRPLRATWNRRRYRGRKKLTTRESQKDPIGQSSATCQVCGTELGSRAHAHDFLSLCCGIVERISLTKHGINLHNDGVKPDSSALNQGRLT